MTFSARMIFRSFRLIRVFEAERTGGLLLFWFLKSRFPAAKSCLFRSNSRWMRKNRAIFGVTLFLTELDRRFWGTSGIRSVSIEGKVRCWFLRRFVRAEFDSGKIPYWFDVAGFGSLRGCSDAPDTGKTEVSKFTYLIACKCYVAVRFSGCFRPAGRIRLFSNIGCGQR